MFAIYYLKNMAAAFLTDKNSNKRQIMGNEACNSARFKNRSCKENVLGSIRRKANGNIKKIKKNNKKKRKKNTTARKLLKHHLYSAMTNGGSVKTTSMLKKQSSLSANTGTNLMKEPLVVIEKKLELDYSRV